MSHIVFNGSFRLLFSEGKNVSAMGNKLVLSGDLKGLLHSIGQESLYCRSNHQLAKLKELFHGEAEALFISNADESFGLIKEAFDDLGNLCEGIFLVNEYSAKSQLRLEQIIKELADRLLACYFYADERLQLLKQAN